MEAGDGGMIRLILIILLMLQQVAYAAPAATSGFDHTAWDSLLKKHVVVVRGGQSTQVDYAGFKTDHGLLKRYLGSTSAISRADFDSWNQATQLAFLVNAYNAWTVELVLTRYPNMGSIKDLGSFLQSPWKRRFIPLLRETRSLDDIEQGLIRGSGRYNDPRIHFAVNCASIGCPALRPEAYVAQRLDAQLDDATQKFLADRSRNRFEQGTLKVSSIFKWYREDFERGWRTSSSVVQFLAMYRQSMQLDNATVNRMMSDMVALETLDYDWRLNDIVKSGKGGAP